MFTDAELCKDLEVIQSVQDGCRNKFWVRRNGELFLLKVSKINTYGEVTYEHVSELIAKRIGDVIDVPVVPIELGGSAILSKVVVDEPVLSFVQYSEEFSHSFHLSNLSTFNISTLLNPSFNKFTKEVIQMLLFDILIGNSDRHPGNFGYTSKGFYPLFDNGSSLLCYVRDVDCTSILKDSKRFNSCCITKSRPVVRDHQKLTHYELLRILQTTHPKDVSEFTYKLQLLKIEELLSDLHMPEERKCLISKFINERIKWFYE